MQITVKFFQDEFHTFLSYSEEDSAMVFVSNEVGEHSIITRDLNVNENTIIQFEVLCSIRNALHFILDKNLEKVEKSQIILCIMTFHFYAKRKLFNII